MSSQKMREKRCQLEMNVQSCSRPFWFVVAIPAQFSLSVAVSLCRAGLSRAESLLGTSLKEEMKQINFVMLFLLDNS